MLNPVTAEKRLNEHLVKRPPTEGYLWMKDDTSKRRIVQITITENCNLNCIYCYEKQKDLHCLPFDELKKIISNEFAKADQMTEYQSVEFDFHGGEVGLFFDRIIEICEWMWSQKWNKPYICFATTNGTLIHGESQTWLWKNRHRFKIGLSLDGTPQMHNMNRSNSFDSIDLKFFRECFPDQHCKMTISPLSIHYLADGIKYIHSQGFDFSANIAYGMTWDEKLYSVYREQLKLVVDFYLENPEIEPINLVSRGIGQIGLRAMRPENSIPKKWCGSGSNMICYAPDGNTYPCQAFMPSTDVKDGTCVIQKIDFHDDAAFRDPQCKNCVLEGFCPNCCAHNYMANGNIWERPKDLCKFRKIEAVAAALLLGKMVLTPEKYIFTRKKSQSELLMIAKGALTVQNELADEIENY